MRTYEQAPEIQQMYSLNMPISAIRTKIRQEFERHRYAAQLKTVDVLLFNSHQEFQVWLELLFKDLEGPGIRHIHADYMVLRRH